MSMVSGASLKGNISIMAKITQYHLTPLLAHKSMRLRRISRVHERHEHSAELLKIDWLREVAVESSVYTLLVDVAEDVGRKRDDGLMGLIGAFLPSAQLFARLVAVFVGHVEIALRRLRVSNDNMKDSGRCL
jgi:hypothetical protein